MIKIFFLLFFFIFSLKADAQHFESTNYNIDWGNFNMTSGKKTSANYSLTDTVGQNAPGEYSKTGFKLKSGFQYIYPFDVFSFAIDNLDINFGTLTAGVASTATSILTITSPSGHGFQITASESTPLRLNTGTTIPDFPGDNVLWTSTTTYGFGFNADTLYFSSANHFSKFANQIIDSSNTPVKNHLTNITYKVNISGVQAAGIYQNYIIYTATPKY